MATGTTEESVNDENVMKAVEDEITDLIERIAQQSLARPSLLMAVIEPLTRPADLWYTRNFNVIRRLCQESVERLENPSISFVAGMSLMLVKFILNRRRAKSLWSQY